MAVGNLKHVLFDGIVAPGLILAQRPKVHRHHLVGRDVSDAETFLYTSSMLWIRESKIIWMAQFGSRVACVQVKATFFMETLSQKAM